MADLITLDRLKLAKNEPAGPSPQDPSYTAAIKAASSIIRNFTGLTFEVAASNAAASERRFEYDGSGYLDIDECQSITSITTESGYSGLSSYSYPLSDNEYSAYPLNLPVKLWLRLAENSYGVGSPEMGFTYNLDRLAYKYSSKPNIIAVTGVWGWPEIPEDVQQAAVWTALNIVEAPKPYQSESIEGYSRTKGPDQDSDPIPGRAQAILMSYIIPRV